jgi:NADPH:quinone reductase-like Zn-dependent oxidoreductase
MRRRYRLLGIIGALAAAAVVSLGLLLSHESPCGPAPARADPATTMKAVMRRCYGPPDTLRLEDIEKPAPGGNEVLIRVHAASVNPLDWHYLRGQPYILRAETGFGTPKVARFGVDYAGTIVAIGKDVERFKPGDEVFGAKVGAFAEYVNVSVDRPIALKPANATFAQAATVPIAAVTALQALRDQGRLQPGQKVLINGASGGVGTFAVQIAKLLGAEVTGVCSTGNVAMVRSLGADHVIDYKNEDYTRSARRYDVIVDNVGNRSLLENRRVLADRGIFVVVGGSSEEKFIGAMWRAVQAWLLSAFVPQRYGFLLAEVTQADLDFLGALLQSGQLQPVIDRRYPLSEVPAAIAYVEQGHAKGKVVIEVD